MRHWWREMWLENAVGIGVAVVVVVVFAVVVVGLIVLPAVRGLRVI